MINQMAFRVYSHSQIMEMLNLYIKQIKNNEIKVPTIEGFCAINEMHKDTIYTRANAEDDEGKEITDALGLIKSYQAKRLIECGLDGTWNSTIVKLLLSANHNIKETSVNEHTGKDGQPLFGLKDILNDTPTA